MNKLKLLYEKNKAAKVGSQIVCPGCNRIFKKEHYQQKFCKVLGRTVCKDKYWNTVTPSKRNNTTRISPASARYLAKQSSGRKRYTSEGYEVKDGVAYDEWGHPVYVYDPCDDNHPFDLDS